MSMQSFKSCQRVKVTSNDIHFLPEFQTKFSEKEPKLVLGQKSENVKRRV